MTNELEQRARTFVAAQYEDDPAMAQLISHGKTTSVDIQRGIAAVAAALRSAEQPSEPVSAPYKLPCPCGLSTCVEPWEPGCGLGNSEEHAIAVPEPAACATCGGRGEVGGPIGQTPEQFDYVTEPCPDCPPTPRSDDAPREAAQEPVAYAEFDDEKLLVMWSAKWLGAHPDLPKLTPLYTHPASLRTVTDDDLTAAVAAWTAHEKQHPKATLDALILTALESLRSRLAGESA